MKSARFVGLIAGTLALYVVLSFVLPGLVGLLVFVVAVPIAVAVKFLAGRRAEGADAAELLVSGAAALAGAPRRLAHRPTGAPH